MKWLKLACGCKQSESVLEFCSKHQLEFDEVHLRWRKEHAEYMAFKQSRRDNDGSEHS